MKGGKLRNGAFKRGEGGAKIPLNLPLQKGEAVPTLLIHPASNEIDWLRVSKRGKTPLFLLPLPLPKEGGQGDGFNLCFSSRLKL
jgi:hypothetical protein